LQALAGSSEENFVITESPLGATIQTAYAGSGKNRMIEIANGEQPTGTSQVMAGFYPSSTLGNAGYITLGGSARGINNESFAIQPNSSDVNYLLEEGNTTGGSPFLASRGSDTNVSFGFDMQGAGTYTFASHSFGETEFQIFGNGGSSWLSTGSSASNAPTIAANGAASNVSIVLQPKGAGVTSSTAPVQLPAFTVSALNSSYPCNSSIENSMAVVTDASSPTYNGTLTGGSSTRIPVFCNGAAWTAH
jgi:hypothetical protein